MWLQPYRYLPFDQTAFLSTWVSMLSAAAQVSLDNSIWRSGYSDTTLRCAGPVDAPNLVRLPGRIGGFALPTTQMSRRGDGAC
ncbi:hypothetical protein M8818_004284 [Zalaria obscura]|uniref:Uncharacterized protein n=1 Tax=Zalaria obscura TaxID=2024903 RepID=A0ACC3SC67_9PEZI